MKRYVALARVSSREQQREGFSLDVQEDALRHYAQRMDGTIVKLFRIAETATKRDERRAFKELLAYAKKHAQELTGLLFYKVDRAARNLFDYGELERLKSELGLEFISVSQPTENTPAGRMQRRVLASMASFYTEQQSLDVKEGLARRVEEGWFVGKAPYGYRNVRIDGRALWKSTPSMPRSYAESSSYSPTTIARWICSSNDWQPKGSCIGIQSPDSHAARSTPSCTTGPTSVKSCTRANGTRAGMSPS